MQKSILDCARCGAQYQFGRGFVFNNKTAENFCPRCAIEDTYEEAAQRAAQASKMADAEPERKNEK